jgi:hypothetical protein
MIKGIKMIKRYKNGLKLRGFSPPSELYSIKIGIKTETCQKGINDV